MGRTREYPVWVVTDNDGNPSRLLDWTHETRFDTPWIPAKLIIEIPEKRVEISESEFWDAYDNSHTSGQNSHREVFERMTKKLFDKQETRG